ncbi:MAG TPA: hypothetical protein VLA34_14125, partial [Candidatus Krumholzibacterium sp.]|nr:hypothetical protein [Candidatus Krumholzibacterium sp.]
SGGRVIDLGPGRREVDALSLFPVVRFSPASLTFVDRYLRDGGDAECIGSLLEHTYRVRPLYAFGIDGSCYPLSGAGCLKKISSLFEKKRRA